MDSIIEGFKKAFLLIISLDRELLSIIFLSFKVSGLALFIAIFLGLPTAALTGLKRFPARGFIISLLNALMGLPPVVAGLFAYLLLSRSGPLGFMELLYTPTAMIIVQSVLAFPIIASICNSAIIGVNPLIKLAAATLGATPVQIAFAVIKEARYGIMSGVIAGLGRLMAEVGAVLIVGGNIAGHTRVMTTTIALETDKGNFELAIALGIILLIIALFINILLYFFQKKGALQSGRDN